MAVTINGTTGIETNTDTGKVKVGASDDLEMYHDGSYSKIKTGGSSHLFIQADYDTNQWLYLDAGHTIELRTTGYETAVKCNPNGSVDLYHNNTKQCETSANGLAFPSGKGIDFSATSDGTTKTSELLDDYEEGTWTPSPRFGGSGAGTSGSYSGHYVKIGEQVTIWFSVALTDKGSFSSSDAYTVVNLPFAGSSNSYSGLAAGYVHRMSTSKQLLATINSAATIDFGLASTGSGVNNDTCYWDDVQDDTHIIGTMTYRV